MSYDINLHRKDKQKTPFTEAELRSGLEDTFEYINTNVVDGSVVDFEVGLDPMNSSEFHYQNESGCYWTYCSYSVDDAVFNKFKSEVKTIATKLDLLIQDPQIDEELINPEDFTVKDDESSKKFDYAQQITEKISGDLPYILPAESKHFILYFIRSQDPINGNKVLLTLGQERLYASKVEVGESIDQVVRREIPKLTGSNEYKLLNSFEYDTAKDRFGNDLPRYALDIAIPYFDPRTRHLKQMVEWKSV